MRDLTHELVTVKHQYSMKLNIVSSPECLAFEGLQKIWNSVLYSDDIRSCDHGSVMEQSAVFLRAKRANDESATFKTTPVTKRDNDNAQILHLMIQHEWSSS